MADTRDSLRSLERLIQGSSDLPPVSRSIHQIAEQSERMITDAGSTLPPPSTLPYAAADPMGTLSLTAASLPSLGTVDTLEAYLAGDQRQILHEAVAEANQLILDESDTFLWQQEREQWDAIKPRILRRRASRPAATTPHRGGGADGGRPHARPPTAPLPHALGRSAVRSARSLEFAGKLTTLWAERSRLGGGGGRVGAPFDLLKAWLEVAGSARVATLEGASTKLKNCWELLLVLSKSASPLLVDGGELSAGFTSTHLRLALLDGAIEHLGSQQLKQLTSSLDEQREAAMRSSVPGVEYDAAAKLTIDGARPPPASLSRSMAARARRCGRPSTGASVVATLPPPIGS